MSEQNPDPNAATPILYTVKTREGLEIGPMKLEEMIKIAQEGQFSSTSMIFKSDTKRWHLAASIPEIRGVLRKYNPRHDSHISKLRQGTSGDAQSSRQFSLKFAKVSTAQGTFMKKTSLFYKLFPFLKKK